MLDTLDALEAERSRLLEEFLRLGDGLVQVGLEVGCELLVVPGRRRVGGQDDELAAVVGQLESTVEREG